MYCGYIVVKGLILSSKRSQEYVFWGYMVVRGLTLFSDRRLSKDIFSYDQRNHKTSVNMPLQSQKRGKI